jgi:hypothetical protein
VVRIFQHHLVQLTLVQVGDARLQLDMAVAIV